MNDIGETLPRYMQVMQVLRERIATGGYGVDTLIPTEAELCEEFSVSRYTIREALRRLTEAGFVARRQGSGTLVIAQEPAGNFTHSMRSLTELFQYAVDTRFAIDEIAPVEVDNAAATLIGCAPGDTWLRVQGLRMTRAQDAIICHTTVFIDMRFAWLEPEMRDCVGPLYALIERRAGVPVAEAVQTTNAVPVPEAIRPLLDMPKGAYALRLVRRYLDRDGATMVVSINHHPADRFSYTMRIRRDALEG
ncbi:MAG: GntR family transcriptional regulator [Salinarimonas sp.]|nr:GntR family transcriptional regulator [Salinarimonas sp.]